MANVLEVPFKNSFLEVALGFFCRQLVKFRQTKKKRCYIMWLFLRVQQNLNHMGCSDAIHRWMTGWTNGWKASRKTTTTSFTICNGYTRQWTLRNMKETTLAVLRVQLVFVLGLGSHYEFFLPRGHIPLS